jgi:ESS family glutamate:Na+ symporter
VLRARVLQNAVNTQEARVTPILVPTIVSVTLGFIVFFLGAFLTRKVKFLREFHIPEPVSGGLVIAIATWVYFVITDQKIQFSLEVRDYLLVVLFSTIGLNAKVADLLKGGTLLLRLLALTLVFMILQNLVGLMGATLFDLPSAISVLLGSASLIGGHGTAIAWGPEIAATTGFAAASELGIAMATLGLICAALLGGPIAKYLIDKNGLCAATHGDPVVGLEYHDADSPREALDHISLMRSMLTVHIAIFIGYALHDLLMDTGLVLPPFVPCLLTGIVLSNTVPYVFPRLRWPSGTRAMAVVSDYALSLFLAMSLMSMELWTLAGLGPPMLTVLFLQSALTAVFVVFVAFRIMGRDYQAAVLSAGFAGFALGATPTAIANMSSVTKAHGSAPLALIILPLVSAFFVDLANAVVIGFFAAF